MGGGGLAVMDDADNWGTSAFGGEWMQVAMHEIMHNLGFGHSYSLPPDQIMGDDASQGTSDLVLPGIGDLTTGLNMFRPDSGDINMYKVTLAVPGTLDAETIAQRLADSSLLNTELRVFEENSDGIVFGHCPERRLLQQGFVCLAVAATGDLFRGCLGVGQ